MAVKRMYENLIMGFSDNVIAPSNIGSDDSNNIIRIIVSYYRNPDEQHNNNNNNLHPTDNLPLDTQPEIVNANSNNNNLLNDNGNSHLSSSGRLDNLIGLIDGDSS